MAYGIIKAVATVRIDFTIIPGDKANQCGQGNALKIGTTFNPIITVYQAGPAESRPALVQAWNSMAVEYTVLAACLDEPDKLECISAPPSDSTSYSPGQIVYLTQINGAWTISQAASVQDLSGVSRARMQVRQGIKNPAIVVEFDSNQELNANALGLLTLNNNSVIGDLGIMLAYTDTLVFTPYTLYEYDIFFHYTQESGPDIVESPIYGSILAFYRVTQE